MDAFVDQRLSLGSFILMGGEVAAMAVIETVARYIDGVLGNEESLADETFNCDKLEYPQYTRPVDFRGKKVPAVLRSGNHAAIRNWQEAHSKKIKP